MKSEFFWGNDFDEFLASLIEIIDNTERTEE